MVQHTEQELDDLLVTTPWFGSLPKAVRLAMLESAKIFSVKRGDRLFSRGDAASGLYAVLEGKIRIFGITEDGREAILTFVECPEWFGEISLMDGGPMTHDAVAELDAELLLINQRVIAQLMAQYPELVSSLGKMLASKLRRIMQGVEQLVALPVRPRLARRLLMLVESHDQVQLELPYSQEKLAATVGLTRQTVNQILNDLQAQGAIRISYGNIQVLDLELLRQLASL